MAASKRPVSYSHSRNGGVHAVHVRSYSDNVGASGSTLSNDSETQVKCPRCSVDLLPTIRHKITVNYCQSCKGMWLEHNELEELEDEVFDFGDRWKGSLAFSSAATAHKCPECSALLQRFKYRFYDMEMEFCPNQHGYWLDDDEDTRVLDLMKREEVDLQRKLLAEDQWTATLRHMRSPSFFTKLRDLFQ